MIVAELPKDEEERINKLNELDILDTLEEQAYDDLTALAAEICHTPIALVSLVDSDRQWFKSHHGIDATETPREVAFCSHAILGDEPLIVEDPSKDERFHDNPLYTEEPHVRFYAGAPLIMSDKFKLGTLCVIGHEARTITPAQIESLEALARQVVTQLELRLKINEMEKLDKAKDEFVAMVSHELRTPLTSMQGSLSLLINKFSDEMKDQQRSLLDVSFRNTMRLLKIVNDILDLTKLESKNLTIEKYPVNLVDIMKKAVELNQEYCSLCDVGIQFVNGDQNTQVLVEGDENRLLQVISNLISNAAKFTHVEDIIEIDVRVVNGFAVVEVVDHGQGITEAQIPRLFEKFKQLEGDVNGKLPGTGIGLNICKQMVELHNGILEVESEPDKRTRFFFSLPVIKP